MWFTVLGLKDAFYCLPFDPDSQELFAFKWEDPETGRKSQLTWTVLPQGTAPQEQPYRFGEPIGQRS